MNAEVNTRYLSPTFYKLTKTTYVKSLQCTRYLYLLKNKPKEKTPPNAETQAAFQAGISFEASFKAQFPNAIDVAGILGRDRFTIGVAYTKALFDRKEPLVIFEACFCFQEVLVMADVCVIHPSGAYEIYEIKNSERLKDVFLQDMAVQAYVISQAQSGMESFKAVLHKEGQFVIQDLTNQLKSAASLVSEQITTAVSVLNESTAPKIKMGEHCNQPYDCEYLSYCSRKK